MVTQFWRRLQWNAYASALALALMLATSTLLLLGLKVNNSPQVYLPPDAPSVILDRELRKEFPNDQVLVALFEGPDLYSDEFLQALERLTGLLEQWPLMDRVLGVTRADHITASEDGFGVEPLLDLADLRSLTPEQRRERVLGDHFAPGVLASTDGQALSLIVRPVPLGESLKRLELEQLFREAVAEVGLEGHLTAVAGHVPLDAAELRSMLRDNLIFVPLTSLVGLLLLWWMVRHVRATLLGFLVITTTVSTTLAALVVVGQPYTLVASMTPPLISALTVAELLHLYNSMALAAQRGMQGREQVEWAVREIRKPALFNSLTLAAGFASLSLNPIPPIHFFGLIGAFGALLIYVIVALLLPPMLSRWPGVPWHTEQGGLLWMRRLTDVLSNWGMRRPLWVIGGFTLILAIGTPFITQIRTETNLLEFFKPDHPITVSTERIGQRLSGVTALQIVFDGAERDALKDPANLKTIKAIQDWVTTLPEVDRAFSLVDFVEQMNAAFHGGDPTFERLPDDRNLISQYLFVYDGRDLYDFVNRDFQRAIVMLSLNVHGAHEIGQVIERIRAHLSEHVGPELRWEIGGQGRLFADQERLLIQGQIDSLGGSMVMLLILLTLTWRSLAAGILTLLPNAAPILVVFIFMGLLHIELNMATALIASVAVGIAVDDTVHFYHGYQQRRMLGVSPSWALARTYHQVGRACVATTVILVAQFAVLMFSDFQPVAQFGLLNCIGFLVALLFDLLMLPALLVLVARARSWKRTAKVTV